LLREGRMIERATNLIYNFIENGKTGTSNYIIRQKFRTPLNI